MQTARLLSTLRPTEVVTYRQRQDDHPFLDDLLRQEKVPGSSLWLVHACMASEVCVWLAGEEEAMPLGSSAGFDVVSEMFSRNMFATPAAADEYQ